MTTKKRSITHATFSLERSFPHPPARVFRAFANKDAKGKWFADPSGWVSERWDMDFRVGGKETSIGRPKDGPRVVFEARYYDILPDERIVYTYEMHINDERISVSLATIQLSPEGKGTRLALTEQGAFLDGFDNAAVREEGTKELLDALAKSLDD